MKKLFMISCFVGAISGAVNAQPIVHPALVYDYNAFPIEASGFVMSSEKAGISIPFSDNAVHTRTANCDYADNATMVGIVWCDQDGNASLSLTGFNGSTFIPAEYSDLLHFSGSSATFNEPLDLGYKVGYPDISIIRETIYSNELVVTVVYQRRLLDTDPWEVVYKRYIVDDFTGFTVSNNFGPFSLGTGKMPAIDAILQVPNAYLQPGDIPFFSNKNVIGFSHSNGYELRIIDNNDNVLESTHIPINIAAEYPDYEYTNEIKQIDLAAVSRTGRGSTGGLAKDVVHLIYLDQMYSSSSTTTSYIVSSWEDIDYNLMTTEPIVVKLMLPNGIAQKGRCKIEAMSIQDYNTTDNHFVALVEMDLSGLGKIIGHNSPTGFTATDYGYLPISGMEVNNRPECPSIYQPILGFDLAAGVGVLGSQNYYTNRHHSVARESHFVANGTSDIDLYLFRFGIERISPALSHFQGQIQLPNSPPNFFVDLYATDNVTRESYTTPYILTRYVNSYLNDETYMVENVSTSASLNTGKFLVKTWIEAGQGVKFKCFNAEIDIDANPGQAQWNTPSAISATALYPNPVQDVLNIENRKDEILSYKVYGIDGKVLLSEVGINTTAHPINVSNLTTGSYILKTQHASGNTLNYKFIKQ